jgi:uncharacterized membrane protein
MSERAAMKRRVRGLLHGVWFMPLLAMVLAALPLAVVGTLIWLLMNPLGALLEVDVVDLLFGLVGSLSASVSLDLTVFSPLMAMLPALSIFIGVCLFVCLPISASVSGYFLGLLRGKKPSPLSVFGCFSARYPRMLGGMLYKALWVFLWLLAAVGIPSALSMGAVWLTVLFAEQLSAFSLYVGSALMILFLLLLVVFALVLINRLLAYALTGTCLAAQPRLRAHRAIRLSRKLMRGCKWRLVALYLSFLVYYIPSLVAAGLLIALPYAGEWLSLTAILQQSLGLFLWIAIGANQLITIYVAPYAAACMRAFYIERKREALMDEEVTPDDFASTSWKEQHAYE